MKVNELDITEIIKSKAELNLPNIKPKSRFSDIVSKFGKIWFFLTIILTVLMIISIFFVFWTQSEYLKSEKNYQRELRIKEMENSLSNAVIDANRNDFELARQTSIEFFAGLEKEVAVEKLPIFNEVQLNVMKGILVKKDSINQLLAEKNPKARDELAKVLATYQKSVKGFQPLNNQEGK